MEGEKTYKQGEREETLLSVEQAESTFEALAGELGCERVALVKNPSFVYSPFEFYPLPPPRRALEDIRAVVMDMDGTTTTTEPLCLHSLEHMVRVLTGWYNKASWQGLHPRKDLPYVVGNSTTRHVEHLVSAYWERVDLNLFARRFLWASAWTLAAGGDEGRKTDAKEVLGAFGLEKLLYESAFIDWGGSYFSGSIPGAVKRLLPGLISSMKDADFSTLVKCAVVVYYQRYHEILEKIHRGGGRELALDVLGEEKRAPVEAMPGLSVFLAMVKGKLGKEGGALRELLSNSLSGAGSGARSRFENLCRKFANRPLRLGIVTSSILYEARIVLSEVLRLIRNEVESWPVSKDLKEDLKVLFGSTDSLYDTLVTASDSSEMRLKPHRDLYAIALNRLGLARQDYPCVMGLEDSQSGVVAVKAAGCGMSVAIPFRSTKDHDFRCADRVVERGLPELILEKGFFLKG